jgi:hypothetical protein
MLGKVAKWLRILGYDAHFERLSGRARVVEYGARGFHILTRNRQWRGLAHVICLEANDPPAQLRELAALIPLRIDCNYVLRRCVICNEDLQAASREDARDRVPDYVLETQTRFHRCPRCHKLYWAGSHPRKMLERLRTTLGKDAWEL